VASEVNRGEKITAYMERHPKLFPHILSQMLSIGEATGKLDETFIYLSELYENEVDEMTKNLSTIIEPALMIFMGLIVGFIAVSIITPIYEITQHLQPR
ncbi:MAG: type II secretion system F family protein, partial [Patescibacteria group bacterium]